jgi:DNA modification methylase
MKPVSEIKMVSVDKLIPYARNARTHSDQQVSQIASSIKEFGFNNPILIKDDFTVIAGHGRLAAATKLGLTEVPTISLSHLTPTQVKAYILADNKLALNAGWDEEMLALEIQELDLEGFDVSLAGFDADEVGKLLAQSTPEGLTDEDEVPEVTEEPVSKLGDVWLLGKHRVMCGDSTMIDSVKKLMNGVLADMVFTDPPYGVSFVGVYGTMYVNGKKQGKNTNEQIINDDLREDELKDLFQESITNAFISTKENSPFYIFFGINKSNETLSAINNCNLTIRNWLIWDKGNVGYHAMNAQYKPNYESFLYCHKKDESPNWCGDKNQQTIWRHSSERLGLHPTMKPISLIEQAFKNHTSTIILDLFGGSGSTLIACEKNGRINRSMELDPKYVDVIVKRWQDFTGNVATLESDGSAFPIPPKQTQQK